MQVQPHEAINWFVNGELELVADNSLDWIPPHYNVAQDPERTKLEELWEAYVHDVQKALFSCLNAVAGKCTMVADMMDADAPVDLYHTLQGAGVGIWDGRWEQWLTREQIEEAERYLKIRLQGWADGSGGGRLDEEFADAADRWVNANVPKPGIRYEVVFSMRIYDTYRVTAASELEAEHRANYPENYPDDVTVVATGEFCGGDRELCSIEELPS